jgi:hypothetical protein
MKEKYIWSVGGIKIKRKNQNASEENFSNTTVSKRNHT